ncbi:MAG: dipeptidyl-peptidase IV [Clostridium sp.]|nr:dipeptidyl-peptidase IV [Clostridium sp.]
MKGFKKIILWAMLSIMMQVSGLLFLDKVFFKHSSEFEFTEVTEKTTVKDVDIAIPSDAEEIKCSYDGKYVTYFRNNKFYLIDTKDGTTEEIITNDNSVSVLYTEWLPDRNRITVAEKVLNDSNTNVIKVINYDAKSKSEVPLKEVCNFKEGMKVDSIATTTLSGVTYVAISNNGKNAAIYRIDINEKMTNIGVKVPRLGKLKIFPHKDVMLYEDKVNGRFYNYSNDNINKINFSNIQNAELLAVDNNDIVYVGEVIDNKVTQIKYGTLDTAVTSWSSIPLEKSKSPKDIYVNDKGEILINDSLEGKVKNLTTSKSVSYEGKFISVNDKVVCSSDNGKIYIKSLSEVD